MWFDTHCHLDAAEFDADRDAVIGQAAAAGVTCIVVPAVEVKNFDAVKTLCAERSTECRLLSAYGIHPMYTPQAAAGDLQILRAWLQERTGSAVPPRQRPVALGEIGLDGFVPGLDMARQEFFLAEQLKLAVEFDLPVILHIRRAQDRVLKHLRRHASYFKGRGAGRAGIAHAFNGSRQQAEAFIELGFILGFGGAMTYAGSTRIRKLSAELPLQVMVLETDAPDIPPAWLGGGRNTPAELPRIASVLAELRGMAIPEVAAATHRNARRLFEGR